MLSRRPLIALLQIVLALLFGRKAA